jgi:hypothetical protein
MLNPVSAVKIDRYKKNTPGVSIAVFGELSQYVMLNYFFLSPQFVLQASFLEFMPVRLTDVTVDLNSNEQWETRTVLIFLHKKISIGY